jgi:hypothetical protein
MRQVSAAEARSCPSPVPASYKGPLDSNGRFCGLSPGARLFAKMYRLMLNPELRAVLSMLSHSHSVCLRVFVRLRAFACLKTLNLETYTRYEQRRKACEVVKDQARVAAEDLEQQVMCQSA